MNDEFERWNCKQVGLSAFLFCEPLSWWGLKMRVEALVFDNPCRREGKETFQTHGYREVFKGFVFFKSYPLTAQWQWAFLHPLEKKVASPMQACTHPRYHTQLGQLTATVPVRQG